MDHRYPLRELSGDYVRAGLGLAATLGPLLFVPASPVMMWLLGGLAALFLAFGARTALRQMTVVRVDDAGITAIGPGWPASQPARRVQWFSIDVR